MASLTSWPPTPDEPRADRRSDLRRVCRTRGEAWPIATNLLGCPSRPARTPPDSSSDRCRTNAAAAPMPWCHSGVVKVQLCGGADGLADAQARTLHRRGSSREAPWGWRRSNGSTTCVRDRLPDLMAGLRACSGAERSSRFTTEQLALHAADRPDPRAASQRPSTGSRSSTSLPIRVATRRSRFLKSRPTLRPTPSFGALYLPVRIAVGGSTAIRLTLRRCVEARPTVGAMSPACIARKRPPARRAQAARQRDARRRRSISRAADDARMASLNDRHDQRHPRHSRPRASCVLGARTLDSDIRWRFVNVRRLFAMIEEAIDEQTQWTDVRAKQPAPLARDGPRGRAAILETLLPPRDARRRHVPRRRMSPVRRRPPIRAGDRARAASICQIGIQPPYPAEFVVVLIGMTQQRHRRSRRRGQQDA